MSAVTLLRTQLELAMAQVKLCAIREVIGPCRVIYQGHPAGWSCLDVLKWGQKNPDKVVIKSWVPSVEKGMCTRCRVVRILDAKGTK